MSIIKDRKHLRLARQPDKTSLGNLARYIIRACFSQERMIYVPAEDSADGVAKVVYTSKDRKSRKVFNALDWLARLFNKKKVPIPQNRPPLGVAASLRSSRLARSRGDQDAIDRLLPDLMPLMKTRDVQEGLASFLERREARFKGV
jgi:enoyl-CoA hydratase/carnithine racemase